MNVSVVKKYKHPTHEEQEDFLVRLYFGKGREYLNMCIDRAYLDFNRTLHGIKNYPDIYKSAKKVLVESLEKICQNKCEFKSEVVFDAWHKRTCIKLCDHYKTNGFETYHIGQAQKWINMTLKYSFTMGDRLNDYSHVYEFCHIPIDNIIIKNFSAYKPPKLSCAWSRIVDYDEYLAYQKWVRNNFKGSSPLAVEFFLWEEK